MRSLSFRERLTLRWTAAFGCVLLVLAVTVYSGTRAFLYRDLDAQLRTLAGTELASATDGPEAVHFHDFPAEEVAGIFAGKFVQLYDGHQTLITQSANLRNGPPLVRDVVQRDALEGRAPVFDVTAAGQPARMIALSALRSCNRPNCHSPSHQVA